MLSQLEQMQQMLDSARAAQQQCQNASSKMGSGLSEWAASLASRGSGQGQQPGGAGQGMKGPGTGAGGTAPIAPTPTGSVDQREKVENRGGDIIARELIEGEIDVGESRAALRRVADRISQGDEEGVVDDPVPPHLRDVHRHYFGELEKRIRAVTRSRRGEDGTSSPTPAPEPTSPSPAPPTPPASGDTP